MAFNSQNRANSQGNQFKALDKTKKEKENKKKSLLRKTKKTRWQSPTQLEVMLLKPLPSKAKKRNNIMSKALREGSLRSFATTIIKSTIIIEIIPSQKTSGNLSNLHVNDYQFRG